MSTEELTGRDENGWALAAAVRQRCGGVVRDDESITIYVPVDGQHVTVQAETPWVVRWITGDEASRVVTAVHEAFTGDTP